MVIDSFKQRYARRATLLLSLMLLIFAACNKPKEGAVDAKRVFAEPQAAEVAEAAAAGDDARVRKLVKGGADPNARGDKGVNLLQWALLNKSKAGLEALLAAGADPKRGDDNGETVVHYAAKADDPAYLDILLSHRVDPNTPNTVTGATPLMSALLGEREEQFRKLLAAGAAPNLADRQGNTSLHLAAKINDSQRVLDLLAAGADATAKNKQGVTFQRYLHMTPVETLPDSGRRQREAIHAWLREHNVPIEDAAAKAP